MSNMSTQAINPTIPMRTPTAIKPIFFHMTVFLSSFLKHENCRRMTHLRRDRFLSDSPFFPFEEIARQLPPSNPLPIRTPRNEECSPHEVCNEKEDSHKPQILRNVIRIESVWESDTCSHKSEDTDGQSDNRSLPPEISPVCDIPETVLLIRILIHSARSFPVGGGIFHTLNKHFFSLHSQRQTMTTPDHFPSRGKMWYFLNNSL